jgi:hypothetical protein
MVQHALDRGYEVVQKTGNVVLTVSRNGAGATE